MQCSNLAKAQGIRPARTFLSKISSAVAPTQASPFFVFASFDLSKRHHPRPSLQPSSQEAIQPATLFVSFAKDRSHHKKKKKYIRNLPRPWGMLRPRPRGAIMRLAGRRSTATNAATEEGPRPSCVRRRIGTSRARTTANSASSRLPRTFPTRPTSAGVDASSRRRCSSAGGRRKL